MRSLTLAVAGLLAFSSLAAPAATTITVIDLPIAGGTVRIATHRPDAPRANLIFLGGGNNVPDLQMSGDGANPQFFPDIQYRSRQHFIDRGYAFIRIDSPAYLYPVGMDVPYRISANTPLLIKAVLDHVLAKDNLPT